MKYMIHACPQRMWYVEGYLLPSLLDQGAAREEVTVWCDKEGKGNLRSFVESMALCGKLEGEGVWHLQDDVCLSASFVSRTAALRASHSEEILCGFGCNFGDGSISYRGRTRVQFLWYSFPCIYISNRLAGEFAAWFENFASRQERYLSKIDTGKMDDWFFREFLQQRHPEEHAYHVTPALVEHVDYLIGGTVVNPLRLRKLNTAEYWGEPEIVEALKKQLDERI